MLQLLLFLNKTRDENALTYTDLIFGKHKLHSKVRGKHALYMLDYEDYWRINKQYWHAAFPCEIT